MPVKVKGTFCLDDLHDVRANVNHKIDIPYILDQRRCVVFLHYSSLNFIEFYCKLSSLLLKMQRFKDNASMVECQTLSYLNIVMLNTSLRKSIGWALFTLSCLSFLLVFLVPFSNLSNTEKVATAGGLYLFCHITWWLCIPLLGKEFISWGRSLWKISVQKIKSAIGKRNL